MRTVEKSKVANLDQTTTRPFSQITVGREKLDLAERGARGNAGAPSNLEVLRLDLKMDA